MTDMYYPIHSEGLYRSLMQAKQYNIPLYITETGIADRSDANRSYMIDQYMQAVGGSLCIVNSPFSKC